MYRLLFTFVDKFAENYNKTLRKFDKLDAMTYFSPKGVRNMHISKNMDKMNLDGKTKHSYRLVHDDDRIFRTKKVPMSLIFCDVVNFGLVSVSLSGDIRNIKEFTLHGITQGLTGTIIWFCFWMLLRCYMILFLKKTHHRDEYAFWFWQILK